MITNLFRYRQYILRNAWNELQVRYAGSSIGILWNILIPLAQILIYTTVFAQLMSLRSPALADNPYNFVFYLCSGLLPWFAFTGSVTRGSNAFLANARYLTKLPVPEEIFVAQLVLAETFSLMIYLVLLVIAGLILGQPLGWTILLLPLAGILFQLLAFGLGLLLGSLRVFFQDIGHLLGVAMQLWLWTLPIIYVENILPPQLKLWLTLNPPYFYLRAFRDLFLYDQVPAWTTWGIMLTWSFGFTTLGYLVLHKLRPDLRDLL